MYKHWEKTLAVEVLKSSGTWCCMPMIPPSEYAEAGGSDAQAHLGLKGDFKSNLCYLLDPGSKLK